jgi:hypothetical protein
MLAVPGRLRLGGARRGHPHAADPHPVVRPSRSIGLPGSAAGDAPIITRPPAAHGTCAPPRSRPAQLLERREHILGELRGPLDRARRMSGARLASRRFRPCRRATLRRAPARHLSGSVTMALVNDGVASQPTLRLSHGKVVLSDLARAHKRASWCDHAGDGVVFGGTSRTDEGGGSAPRLRAVSPPRPAAAPRCHA